MESAESQTPLTERKLMRRGLLAGAGALAIGALARFTAKPAQAVDPQDIDMNTVNTSASLTTLNSAAAGASGYTVLKVENFRIADAIEAVGGPGNFGNAGQSGLVATGGANSFGTPGGATSDGGDAILATGGSTAGGSGVGGRGLLATGGVGSFVFSGGDGVRAVGGSPGGVGMRGVGGGTNGSQGAGVIGTTNSTNPGVLGTNSGTGPGVEGQASGQSILGVRGVHIFNGTGVKGVSNAANSSSADGNGSGIGVHGRSGSGSGVQGDAPNGYGVVGNGGIIGLLGIGTTGAGIWGQSTSYIGVVGSSVGVATAIFGFSTSTGFGVHGESQSSAGVMAVAKTANAPGLFAQNTTAGAGKLAAFFDGNIFIQGSYTATGAKLAIVPHPDGVMRSLYCTEATEPLFEDYGRAQLVGGVARVQIDPNFAPLVHRTAYHVFTEAEGDCRGLYVSQQDVSGFEVREVQGGKSSVPFSYRIVAKRVDVVGERLKKVSPDAMNAVKAQASAAANAPRPTGPLNPSTLNGAPGGGQPAPSGGTPHR